MGASAIIADVFRMNLEKYGLGSGELYQFDKLYFMDFKNPLDSILDEEPENLMDLLERAEKIELKEVLEQIKEEITKEGEDWNLTNIVVKLIEKFDANTSLAYLEAIIQVYIKPVWENRIRKQFIDEANRLNYLFFSSHNFALKNLIETFVIGIMLTAPSEKALNILQDTDRYISNPLKILLKTKRTPEEVLDFIRAKDFHGLEVEFWDILKPIYNWRGFDFQEITDTLFATNQEA